MKAKLVKEDLNPTPIKSLNEDTTDSFIVSTKDKRIRPQVGPSREYFAGKKIGQADMIINVFSGQNHKEEAQRIYNALKDAGLENRYYSIKIEVK